MRRGYQAKNLEIVLRDRTGGKKDIPMMMSDVPELHVCPECMAEDEEPYLHTVHQLPGVRMCLKHRIPLMRGEVPESSGPVRKHEPEGAG